MLTAHNSVYGGFPCCPVNKVRTSRREFSRMRRRKTDQRSISSPTSMLPRGPVKLFDACAPSEDASSAMPDGAARSRLQTFQLPVASHAQQRRDRSGGTALRQKREHLIAGQSEDQIRRVAAKLCRAAFRRSAFDQNINGFAPSLIARGQRLRKFGVGAGSFGQTPDCRIVAPEVAEYLYQLRQRCGGIAGRHRLGNAAQASSAGDLV